MKIPGGTGAYGAQKPMENIDFIVPGGGGSTPIPPEWGKKGWRSFHYIIKNILTSLLYILICYLSNIG